MLRSRRQKRGREVKDRKKKGEIGSEKLCLKSVRIFMGGAVVTFRLNELKLSITGTGKHHFQP